jgi:hypothetical protein
VGTEPYETGVYGIVYHNPSTRNALRERESIKKTLEGLPTAVATHVSEALHADSESLPDKMERLVKEVPGDAQVVSDISSYVRTERGKCQEGPSLDRYQASVGKISQRNGQYYKKTIPFGTEATDVLQLGGRVDGITEDGKLVEMKNRQYRMFSFIPTYEKVQVHAYMFLTGILECHLVQSYKGKEVSSVVPFEESFWDDIVKLLRNFAKGMKALRSSESLQDQLLMHQSFPAARQH